VSSLINGEEVQSGEDDFNNKGFTNTLKSIDCKKALGIELVAGS
tara:strand:+ start:619 stop:750 length:132 start_codon:yes stop_codon:yes gene_type:complete